VIVSVSSLISIAGEALVLSIQAADQRLPSGDSPIS
jgi:hypothetical protein